MRTLSAILLVAVVCGIALAQAPDLAVTISADRRTGVVTNNYTRLASEYLLAATHAEGAGQARYTDLIDSIGAGEPGLAPGASRTLSLPPNVLSVTAAAPGAAPRP